MTKTLLKKLDAWERELYKALSKGKGKYSDYVVRDVWDYLKLVHIMKYRWNLSSSVRQMQSLLYKFDSVERDRIPRSVYNFLYHNGFEL